MLLCGWMTSTEGFLVYTRILCCFNLSSVAAAVVKGCLSLRCRDCRPKCALYL